MSYSLTNLRRAAMTGEVGEAQELKFLLDIHSVHLRVRRKQSEERGVRAEGLIRQWE